MMLEADLRTYLLGAIPQQYIGTNRVYGVIREQAAPEQLPAALIVRTSTTRSQTLCGTMSLVNAEIQIDSYAMTGDEAWGLAREIRHALVDFEGSMGDTPVKKVFLTNEFPLADPEPGLIRVVQLFNFWYQED